MNTLFTNLDFSNLNFWYIFFCVFIGFTIIVVGKSKKGTDAKVERDNFLARESAANLTRRQDISNLPYIYIDLDDAKLEKAKELGVASNIDKLLSYKERKLLDLSDFTNTDLKAMYGPANLPELTDCDTNFADVIMQLNLIGKKLFEEGSNEAIELAVYFLEYAVWMGSSITESFELLANYYVETNNQSKFDILMSDAKDLHGLSAETTINRLNIIKKGAKFQ